MPMIPILALATLCTTLTILRLVAGTAGSWHASQGALAGSTNLSRLEYGNLETTSSSTLVHAPDEASIFTTISASGNEGESVAVTRSSSAAATSAAYTAGKAQGWRSLFASDGDGATAVPVTAPTHAPTKPNLCFVHRKNPSNCTIENGVCGECYQHNNCVAIANCDSGWVDADEKPFNGCETHQADAEVMKRVYNCTASTSFGLYANIDVDFHRDGIAILINQGPVRWAHQSIGGDDNNKLMVGNVNLIEDDSNRYCAALHGMFYETGSVCGKEVTVYTYRDLPWMKAQRNAAKFRKFKDSEHLAKANKTYWQLYRNGFWCGRSGKASRTFNIDCDGKSDLTWLLHTCSTNCIKDPAQSCCRVPHVVASYFPCCRTKDCCTDQGGIMSNGGRRRLSGASVSTTVEAGATTLSKYERLVNCLDAAGKVDDITATIRTCEHEGGQH